MQMIQKAFGDKAIGAAQIKVWLLCYESRRNIVVQLLMN